MQCNQLTPSLQRSLRSFASVADLYDPFTEWMPAIGVDRVRATLKPYNGGSTDMIVKLAVQYAATRPETPGAWSASALASATPGTEAVVPLTLAGSAESQMWFRLGTSSNLNGGSATTSTVALQAAWNACGRIVTQRSLSLFTLPASSTSVEALTDWLPVIGVDAVKVAIELARVDRPGGTFNYQIVYQKADADVSAPGAWTALSKQYTHSDAAVNTGELAIDLPSSMFVRFGVLYWQTTSDTTRADVNVVVAVRHDPLTTFGDVPTNWGTQEGGMSAPTIENTRAVYTGSASGSNKICGSYASEFDNTFTWSAYATTSGNPSGPGAWVAATGYVWLGYDDAAGAWKVYNAAALTSTPSAVGSSLTGPGNAIARVVGSSGTCSWQVSFDGRNFTTLHTIAQSFTWRYYVVQKDAVLTVKRELLS